MAKKEVYKWIKIGGLLSFIPLVLGTGALGGYFLGKYLENRFKAPSFVPLLLSGLGTLAAYIESVRIIKLTLKAEKK